MNAEQPESMAGQIPMKPAEGSHTVEVGPSPAECQDPVQQPVNLAKVPMPKFLCHKMVEAAQIVGMQELGPDPQDIDLILDPADGRDQFVHQVSIGWCHRHRPCPGGYLVRDEEGYEYFSPQTAFAIRYSRVSGLDRESSSAGLPVPMLALREIESHRVNEANDRLRIEVLDEPGPGGANHLYRVSGFNTESNPSCPFGKLYGKSADHAHVLFQNGAIGEAGVNGITHEVLIAILIDRLLQFQAGRYQCQENADALLHLTNARAALKARTQKRVAAGVEGTMQP